MTYRVSFYKIVRNRKRGTYERHDAPTVTVSDYGVDQANDYAEAAFKRRPELRNNVSGFQVSELKQQGNKLIGYHFMSGNDHPNCRDFYITTP